MTVAGTSVDASIRTVSGTSINDGSGEGTDVPFINQGDEDIAINEINYLNSPRVIASRVNELNTSKLNITSIPTNIESFVNYAEFYTQSFLGIKDVFVNKDDIYISYTKQLKEDCFNISVLKAKINYEKLKFSEFFSVDECTTRTSIYDDNMHHAGGRIISLDDSTLLLTVGDFGNYEAIQDDNSYFGKIIKINVESKEFTIVSKGHRNPQGLVYDRKNNNLISTYGGWIWNI